MVGGLIVVIGVACLAVYEEHRSGLSWFDAVCIGVLAGGFGLCVLAALNDLSLT